MASQINLFTKRISIVIFSEENILYFFYNLFMWKFFQTTCILLNALNHFASLKMFEDWFPVNQNIHIFVFFQKECYKDNIIFSLVSVVAGSADWYCMTCRLLHPKQLWIVTAYTWWWDQSLHGRAVPQAKAAVGISALTGQMYGCEFSAPLYTWPLLPVQMRLS